MLEFRTNEIKNICLIGLMGSGKSVLGRELSKYYKLDFFDTDNEIEKETNKSIETIFKDYGEAYFRKIEESVCLKVLKYSKCIISLGGGSITNLKIRNLVKKNSYSIYLKVDNNILIKRLKNSKKRPLLKNIDKKFVIEKLYNERKKFYNIANLVVENNFDKKDIISKIIIEINKI
tara:strand:- start:1225 stop:1752 length:528 start_codon:yes stop_codon:yes gene_type:complete